MGNSKFDQIANRYDTIERKELARVISEAVKTELADSKSKTLLDYGSGTGIVGLELAYRVDKLILMDSSEPMLELAKEKIARNKTGNVETIRSDFMKGDSDVRADIILASLVLLHISVVSQILERFHSSLNEEGRLIIVDFDRNEKVYHPDIHNGFSQDELRSLLMDAGFRNVEIRTFHHGRNIFMNQDASLFIAVCLK